MRGGFWATPRLVTVGFCFQFYRKDDPFAIVEASARLASEDLQKDLLKSFRLVYVSLSNSSSRPRSGPNTAEGHETRPKSAIFLPEVICMAKTSRGKVARPDVGAGGPRRHTFGDARRSLGPFGRWQNQAGSGRTWQERPGRTWQDLPGSARICQGLAGSWLGLEVENHRTPGTWGPLGAGILRCRQLV